MNFSSPLPMFEPVDTSGLTRCEGCPHRFARLVGTRGDPENPFVVVGESPGIQEVKAGKPFVGPSGTVLDHALSQFPEIAQSNPYIINAIQCFPGTAKTKSQDRTTQAAHVCQGRLLNEIRRHPRKIILALGNPASWATTNDFGTKITRVRGKRSDSALAELGIVSAVHPAFLLRGGGSMRQFLADVAYACKLYLHGERALKRYVEPKVHVATTRDNVVWLANEVAKHSHCAADVETGGYQGFDFLRDRILCVGFCFNAEDVYVVPEELLPHTRYIFRANKGRTHFIWHNGKFDQKFFWAAGIPEARVDDDTMLLSYALDETGGIHDLEQVASDILGAPDWKFMIKEYVGKGKTYADIPRPILYDYMAKDISCTLQIFPFLRNLVALDPGLDKLYTQTLMRMSLYMARIEFRGMLPDLERVKQNQRDMTAQAEALELKFNEIAIASGHGALNPRSPKQVGAFLYDTLKLRDPRRPKAIPTSTDEDTLNTLSPHPAVKALLEYRTVQKGLSTYVNSVEEHVGADGRIHTTYLIHGTTSGRPASRNPNVLNIPRDPKLRGQFVAGDGQDYMEVDVNQAELRTLAELSHDPVLEEIYLGDKLNIHKVTQTEMFGSPELYTDAQITDFLYKFSVDSIERMLEEQNMRAKTVNFGIVYGRTAMTIAEEFKMPIAEAQAWIDAWFRKYQGAHRFIQACRNAPLQARNLITPFGRKRRFQIVNRERLNDIQNQAANFPEQSIASDCVTETGIRIQPVAERTYGAHIVNTVYDSILFECPSNTPRRRELMFELGARVLNLLRFVPKEYGLTTIPFKGDLKIGNRWGNLKKTPIPPDIKARVDARWPNGL